MATPTLTRHIVPGVLGDINVDVRAGGRDAPRAAVVTVHGFKGFKDWGMWPPFAERLARGGVTAVSLNLSGSGVDDSGSFAFPERFGHNTFSAELEDLGRVIAALYRGDLGVAIPSSLGLVGHSRGGGSSLLHTVRDSRVRALATWSAISTVERWRQPERERWRRTGVQEVRNARTGEVLPLYTDVLDDIEQHAADPRHPGGRGEDRSAMAARARGEDEAVSIAEANRLAEVAGGPRTEVLVIEGAGHTFGAMHPWNGSNPALDRVFDATLAFLARELG